MPKKVYDEEYDYYEEDLGDPVQAVVDQMMEHPQVRGVFAQVTGILDQFGYVIDRAAKRVVVTNPQKERQYQETLRRAQHLYQKARAAEARAAAKSRGVKKENPRLVMGFEQGQKLTEGEIKGRQRALAAIYHPDRPGGSTQAMQRLNAAAETLLAELKV